MVDLAIVIVSWNSRDDIDACLKSIRERPPRCSFAITVVDNGSTDGTVTLLESTFPEVHLILNADNVGFAAANNQALRTLKCRYALLLNPDTVLRPDALDVMVGFMDRNPDAWAAGPAVFNRDGTRQRTGVTFPGIWNILVEAFFLDRVFPRSRMFGRHKQLYEDPAQVRHVDYVQGACLMVPFKVLEKVGGLDEQFFMYFEETDWCFRMKKAGGHVWYVPSAEVVHLGGGKVGQYNETRLIYYHRSLLLFFRKHHSFVRAMVVRLILVVRSFVRIVAWLGVVLVKPNLRVAALSSVRGYCKTYALIFQRTSGT
ncbi:MAG TPA: glycosyltransferase family 2 protein [Bacteroidota bacterium]|nr:glycosyltransferase family 2 protein [Bacteroidota bacterium]